MVAKWLTPVPSQFLVFLFILGLSVPGLHNNTVATTATAGWSGTDRPRPSLIFYREIVVNFLVSRPIFSEQMWNTESIIIVTTHGAPPPPLDSSNWSKYLHYFKYLLLPPELHLFLQFWVRHCMQTMSIIVVVDVLVDLSPLQSVRQLRIAISTRDTAGEWHYNKFSPALRKPRKSWRRRWAKKPSAREWKRYRLNLVAYTWNNKLKRNATRPVNYWHAAKITTGPLIDS